MGCQYIFIRISNLKSEMILALIVKISSQSVYERRRKTLFNVVYRPPSGKIEPFENFFKILFNESKNSNENYHIAKDFNLNPLSANFAKSSNTLKQFVGKLPTNCLSVLTILWDWHLKG